MRVIVVLALVVVCSPGCAVFRLAGYAMKPDAPAVVDGARVELEGLQAPVSVAFTVEGIPVIHAHNEHDLMFVEGWLQARDRMFQLDLLRHLARGEVAALVGLVPFGDGTSLDMDRRNRALGFARATTRMVEQVSAAERAAAQAYADGINAWIATGQTALEHRLLGVDRLRPWTVEDSMAIYRMLMFSLSGNHGQEYRRLLIACRAGLDAVEEVWPTQIAFGVYTMPPLQQPPRRMPAIVPEVREVIDGCRTTAGGGAAQSARRAVPDPVATQLAAVAALLRDGFSASNNWVVSGRLTASGKPLVANDPHLPHMNPPIVWGVIQEIPEYRVSGFTLVGLHRVVFGHNGYVAWGATTNYLDRQDFALLRVRGDRYARDGRWLPFRTVVERFEVRGEDPVTAVIRYTDEGPVFNDLEPRFGDQLPPIALRTTGLRRARDPDAARALATVRTADEFVRAIRLMDSGCTNWVYADQQGEIGWESPCLLPVREGYSGGFPVPGWLSRYAWKGFVPKDRLPALRNPERGFIETSNHRHLPPGGFYTTYDGDASEPNRFIRASELLTRYANDGDGLTVTESARIQTDVVDAGWSWARQTMASLCDAADDPLLVRLCAWDGAMRADSVEATLYVWLTDALIDLALADVFPDGYEDDAWKYVQSMTQFEVNVQWTWWRPVSDSVWDDRRTTRRETRDDILRAAWSLAMKRLDEQLGDRPDVWRWGIDAAPFVLRHPFASDDNLLSGLFNIGPLPRSGGPSTVLKAQFPRSDRRRHAAAIGPVIRLNMDLGNLAASRFALAGGQSGWPKSPHYGDLTESWNRGEVRTLAGAAMATMTFIPPDNGAFR